MQSHCFKCHHGMVAPHDVQYMCTRLRANDVTPQTHRLFSVADTVLAVELQLQLCYDAKHCLQKLVEALV